MQDGSVLICDLLDGAVRRVQNGQTSLVAQLDGAPNGLALGSNGWIYVANNGGAMKWRHEGDRTLSEGFDDHGFDSRIDRFHLASGQSERVLDSIDGRLFEAIDDLVIDQAGGIWFTDLGRNCRGPNGARSPGSLYWASQDGAGCRCAAGPLEGGANGIGLSPDGRVLYATEYEAGRLWAWDVLGPGRLSSEAGTVHGGRLLFQTANDELFDSLAVDADGNVVVATQPTGCFTVVTPRGQVLSRIAVPDPYPTSLRFAPGDPATGYATLGSTGTLIRLDWAQHRRTWECGRERLPEGAA
jgi:gluconolactonase